MNTRIMQLLITIMFGIGNFASFSQNSGIGINPSGSLPDPSAALDVDFNNKGFLIPRLTTVQRDAIQNPAIGLQIYNTTLNCLQGFMPISGWRDIVCDCSVFPSSAFTFPNNSGVNTNTAFQATTSGATYSWVFDQGSPATSNQQSPTVTWGTAGTYNVTLTVTDNLGCSSTTTQTVTIVNCNPNPGSVTFNYTGSQDQWTMPNLCSNTVTIEVWGAEGGIGYMSGLIGPGGRGGYATGTVQVNQGTTLYINVGGQGVNGGQGSGGAGGFNGGALGGSYSSLYGGGGGGGASDVRMGGQTLNDRIIVAGGGGGGSYYAQAAGGGGGYPNGADGLATSGGIVSTKSGRGGTQSAGGAGGTDTQAGSQVGTAGTFGNGGNSGVGSCSGGGGGGWYGGGGGSGCNGGGGGGGSSYIGGMTGNTNTQNAVRSGNGQVIISW